MELHHDQNRQRDPEHRQHHAEIPVQQLPGEAAEGKAVLPGRGEVAAGRHKACDDTEHADPEVAVEQHAQRRLRQSNAQRGRHLPLGTVLGHRIEAAAEMVGENGKAGDAPQPVDPEDAVVRFLHGRSPFLWQLRNSIRKGRLALIAAAFGRFGRREASHSSAQVAGILCVFQEKVTKSGHKLSGRRRRRFDQRLLKGFLRKKSSLKNGFYFPSGHVTEPG